MNDVTRPWWALAPLRLFLGITFTYAGLQKFSDPHYLDASAPTSVQSTILSLQHQSPIGFLLGWSAHAPALVGVLIALGELAVGLATLAGFLTRIAAAGGFLLATTFFLTVSWHTHPYFYGSDIVFMAAWSVPLLLGAWGGPTLDAVIANRAARDPDPQRRRVLLTAGTASAMAVLAGAFAGIAAAVGRGGGTANAAAPPPSTPTPSPSPHRSPRAHPTNQQTPQGTLIAHVADVPSGGAVNFTDSRGAPAVLIHESNGDFRAFSRICTHAGCLVQFAGLSQGLICPCHGGQYDASSGQVVAGPPPAPLQALRVAVNGGDVLLV